MQLPIIYRDEHLLAINKPAGLLVHKSPIDKHEKLNAVDLLTEQIGQKVHSLHRLDRPTSGVLLFGLNAEVAREMGLLFQEHLVRKTYQAIVRGYMPEEGIIDHPLKEIADFRSDKEYYEAKEAQEAVTAFKCLGTLELPYAQGRFSTSRYSLVELYPKTGRKHQLRRHMKHLSHPIVGDTKYGKSLHNNIFKKHFNSERLLLAAISLHFEHPKSKKEIIINAEPDALFRSVVSEFNPS